MPAKSARGRPREFDQEQAIDAAMETFWKYGFMQTRLGDLCQAMGISHPSFYNAFGAKTDLFLKTLDHYVDKYWNEALENLMWESDVSTAFMNFFTHAVEIYNRPNLSRGCFFDISTVGLSEDEKRIANVIDSYEKRTLKLFRRRLSRAIEEGQIAADNDVDAIAASFTAFLTGVAALARKDIGEKDLNKIAIRGIGLLPPRIDR